MAAERIRAGGCRDRDRRRGGIDEPDAARSDSQSGAQSLVRGPPAGEST